MKTSGKAHGNLWDATVPRPYAQLANLRREEEGLGARKGGRQSTHSSSCIVCLWWAAARDCAHSPFALIVNNGPPWKIIVEAGSAGRIIKLNYPPHLGTHLAAFFNQHKIYQIKFECSGVVQIKCKAAETSTKITCQSHCNQCDFPFPFPSTPSLSPPFHQPTPYWWWVYVMFVPEKICMWKAFPLAAWAPAKLAIKWLKKEKKNKCKTLKWNWNRLKWNQIANESQLCLPFIVRGYSNIANVLRRRRLSAAHKSFNSNWFVNI